MFRAPVATFLIVWLASGCGPFLGKKRDAPADDSATTQTPPPETAPPTDSATTTETSTSTDSEQSCGIWCEEEPHVVCTLPSGAPSRPAKIADLVTLLNLLPMPVTLPCLLDVLPKPYELTATRGRSSLQPAHDAENPRVFVFIDGLILSFVPDGPDRELLEVSEVQPGDATSVKGELEFPLKAPVAPSAFYDRVQRKDGIEGTRCARCHNNDAVQPGAEYEGKAFVSQALRPLDAEIVPLSTLRELGTACKGVVSRRCDVFRAMLGEGEGTAKERLFPKTMPTMF